MKIRYSRLIINYSLIKNKFAIYNRVIIIKIVSDEYEFRLIALIKINIFNNNINYIKERLVKLFDDSILFKISRLS